MKTIIVDGTRDLGAIKSNLQASIQSFEPNVEVISAEAIDPALSDASEIILMISQCPLSNSDLQALITAARSSDSVITIGAQSLEDASTGGLVQLTAYDLGIPAAIALTIDRWRDMNISSSGSAAQIAASILGIALSGGAEIRSLSSESAYEVSSASRAEMLKTVLESHNIEDIFPNHSWDAHQEESLAACYHTLAAIFIRLGDFESAEECLSQSDTFEDSPRALALKAIISKLHGETLGAVANMVSSLQQYEQRKNRDGSHYLTFKPTDIEKINYRLKEGLEALNQRDNEAALSKFTEAVFDFDSFYTEMGLDKIN